MPLFTSSELTSRSRASVATEGLQFSMEDMSSRLLKEAASQDEEARQFDVFLSHSYLDAAKVNGLKLIIQDMGFSVYVDWIDDPDLDRRKVSRGTAERVRMRMRKCRSLFFAFSENSPISKWMPWECGYFDGFNERDGVNGRVAVCPVVDQTSQSEYSGQEYLSLYPYVQKNKPNGGDELTLWVYETRTKYMIFKEWIKGKDPTERSH